MEKQETEFRRGEGDAWFERNKNKPHGSDPVIEALGPLEGEEDIIEIGSGRGHRLASLCDDTTGDCIGFDPSAKAVAHSNSLYKESDNLWFQEGTATHFAHSPCDILIYGFCLYLCDRKDLPEIVAAGDRALRDGGKLVIHDFDPEYPHMVRYHHVSGLFSYKMDHSKLWLANPAYSLVNKLVIPDGTAVWVLKKDMDAGWPLEELKNV